WEDHGGYAGIDASIQAAVLFNGEFDLPTWWQYGKSNEFMLDFIGCSYEDNQQIYQELSPLTHVDQNTCASLLIHGEDDVPVPIAQSVDYHNKLLSVGVHSELVRIPDVGHAWFNDEPHVQPCLEKMQEFLLERLA
ncbi:MAG: prolyl oligopeptidase family serine peptidase, partial [Planctomycetes bacterium]|nr:prolyl oligopeptidase family serine peptidase [Planctomycetota bacterium]